MESISYTDKITKEEILRK